MRAAFTVGLIAFLSLSTATRAADKLSELTGGSQWSYMNSRDEMSGKTGVVACASSVNQLKFSFPYSGGSYGQICLRKGPEFGHDIYVNISKGQMLCPGYSGCHLRVRFDDGVPFIVEGAGPSDGSATIAFMQGYAGLVAKMKRAKSMMVEIEFYQHGRQILYFDISGLRWD